ncbi:MAG: cell surface protein, partial [Verrucomicrobia bacterium]
WVMKWAELLQIRSRQEQFSQKAALAYYQWLRGQLLANVPLDQIVRELLTASGSTLQNPAANYYQVTTDTLKIAENTAQVFLGMRLQCAQCHNHPFDRWTMNDYYSFAAFFSRVSRKPGEDPREAIVFDKGEGEVNHLVSGKPMPPKFLGADHPQIPPGQSRRAVLAAWLASPENPHLDDVRISNPASNPELLEALAARFTAYQYDFKKLVGDICTSRTYQLSTRPNETNEGDDRNFAKAAIRRLRAEVLLDCVSQITETQDKFTGLPRGARAVQIADGNTTSYFLTTFGRATRQTPCSCEVKAEPNLSQALHLLNGSTVENKISEGAVVRKMLTAGWERREIIENLYLRCLSRKPTEAEMAKLLGFFKDGHSAEEVLQDLFWSLLNSKEFVFNH